jgi:hypothetical protein
MLTARSPSAPVDGTPAEIQALVNAVVDRLAETFENLKSTLQANGKYNKVVLLTDVNCTRAKLLENLVFYTKQGMTIDLLILGHGSPNALNAIIVKFAFRDGDYGEYVAAEIITSDDEKFVVTDGSAVALPCRS